MKIKIKDRAEDVEVKSKLLESLGNGLASVALRALIEARDLELKENKPELADYSRILEATAILEKEREIYEKSLFSSRAKKFFSEEELATIHKLARE